MLKVTDLEKVKEKFHVGDPFLFKTTVWFDINDCRCLKVKGNIKGIYPHGIIVKFRHTNCKGEMELTRWLSYKDIILDRMKGNVPLATSGRTYDNEGSY